MSGRIRTLKPELLEDALIATLSDGAFRLYVGSILLADDYGNFRAEPRKLLGDIFWGHRLVGVEDVERFTAELWAAGRDDARSVSGLLLLYRVRGQLYAHIRNWEKHQRIDHVGSPRCPKPDDKESQQYRPNSSLLEAPAGGSGNGPLPTLAALSPHDGGKTEQSSPNARDSRPSRETLAPDQYPDPDLDLRSGSPIPITSASPITGSGEPAPVPTQTDTEAPLGSHASTPLQRPLLPDMPSAEAEVFEHWLTHWRRHVNSPRVPKLDPKRRAKIRARLREGFTVDELRRAVDGIWASEFHLGDNQHGKRYTDIELVCRDAKHVEDFMLGAAPQTAIDEFAGGIPLVPPEPEPTEPTGPPPPEVAERIQKLLASKGRTSPLLPDLDAEEDAAT